MWSERVERIEQQGRARQHRLLPGKTSSVQTQLGRSGTRITNLEVCVKSRCVRSRQDQNILAEHVGETSDFCPDHYTVKQV